MRKPTFKKLSSSVLAGYLSEIDQILKDRKAASIKGKVVLKKVLRLLDTEGLTIEDLQNAIRSDTPTGKKASAKKVQPKYANPRNKAQTWTGRGRKPLWVQNELNKGKKLESLAI